MRNAEKNEISPLKMSQGTQEISFSFILANKCPVININGDQRVDVNRK